MVIIYIVIGGDQHENCFMEMVEKVDGEVIIYEKIGVWGE